MCDNRDIIIREKDIYHIQHMNESSKQHTDFHYKVYQLVKVFAHSQYLSNIFLPFCKRYENYTILSQHKITKVSEGLHNTLILLKKLPILGRDLFTLMDTICAI